MCIRDSPSLHSPFSPPYSQPFPSSSLPPLFLITARGSGERYSSPAGPGGTRPPNAFLCNSQPQICKSVKSSRQIFFLPGTRGPLHSGPLWTLPTLPTPLLRHCRRGVVVSVVQRMNEVTPRRALLVLGRTTVFGQTYHLGIYPSN